MSDSECSDTVDERELRRRRRERLISEQERKRLLEEEVLDLRRQREQHILNQLERGVGRRRLELEREETVSEPIERTDPLMDRSDIDRRESEISLSRLRPRYSLDAGFTEDNMYDYKKPYRIADKRSDPREYDTLKRDLLYDDIRIRTGSVTEKANDDVFTEDSKRVSTRAKDLDETFVKQKTGVSCIPRIYTAETAMSPEIARLEERVQEILLLNDRNEHAEREARRHTLLAEEIRSTRLSMLNSHPYDRDTASQRQSDGYSERLRRTELQKGSDHGDLGAKHRIEHLEYELERKESEMRARELKLQEHERHDKERTQALYELDKEKELELRLRSLERKERLLEEREVQLLKRERALEELRLPDGKDAYPSESQPQYSPLKQLLKRERALEELRLPYRKDTYPSESQPQYSSLKFSVFSGEDPRPRAEVSYEEWAYEVNCVSHLHTEFQMAQAIRKSLRGQAKRILLPMGPSATVKEMLSKLENSFGNVATGESVLQEFYSASQRSDESIAAWGLRLEEILQIAIDKGHIEPDKRNAMLRSKFWRALRSEKLKNATRVHYETIQNFELLRREVRAEEHEIKLATGIQHHPMQAIETNKLDQLMERMTSLEKQMKATNRSRRGRRRLTDDRENPSSEDPKDTKPKVTSGNPLN